MRKHIVMVLAGAASYGMLSSFAKIAYGQGYTAAEITFAQALIGALILWTPVVFKQIRARKLPSLVNWRLLVAGLGMGASAYTYYLSVQYIPASLAIVLLMQMTWMSIFLEWLIFKRKPLVAELCVTALILAGTVLAGNLLSAGTFQFSLAGVGYALLSALMYSVYIIATSRLGDGVPMFEKSALMISGSVIAIFIINFSALKSSAHFDLGLLKWGIFLAVFGTVIPPMMFTRGMPRIGAGLSSILLTMELPVAVICAHFILKEEITAIQVAGILLMFGSIVYLNWYKDRRRAKEEVLIPPARSAERISPGSSH